MDLRYNVNIFYKPPYVNGQQSININGVTSSIPTYGGNYFFATMPELSLVATGSSYTTALNNLLIAASASRGPLALSEIKYF